MIKIITDSTVYLSKDEASFLSVRVIPMHYGAANVYYTETFSDKNGDFMQFFKNAGKITTSQPNLSEFISAFEEETAQGNEILCITISSRMSGTFNTAYTAAKQTDIPTISVFDSQLVGGGLYLLIKEAKKLIDSGCSLEEICKVLPKIRESIVTVFSVDDMTPLRKSGRIGYVRMRVNTWLNIKPILFCSEGAVVYDSMARGNVEIIKKLVASVPEGAKEAVINYISNTRTASNLYNVLREKNPSLQIKLNKMGPVLATHLGLQVIALSHIE